MCNYIPFFFVYSARTGGGEGEHCNSFCTEVAPVERSSQYVLVITVQSDCGEMYSENGGRKNTQKTRVCVLAHITGHYAQFEAEYIIALTKRPRRCLLFSVCCDFGKAHGIHTTVRPSQHKKKTQFSLTRYGVRTHAKHESMR